MEEERVVGLGGRLGDGQRRGVGEPVALADHEAIEAVLRVELRVIAPLAVASLDRPEADLVERGLRPGEPVADQRGVAALDPGADPLRGAEVEGPAPRADDPHRLQPEAEGRLGDRGAKPRLDLCPDGVEALLVVVIVHPEPTIATAPGARFRPPRKCREILPASRSGRVSYTATVQ